MEAIALIEQVFSHPSIQIDSITNQQQVIPLDDNHTMVSSYQIQLSHHPQQPLLVALEHGTVNIDELDLTKPFCLRCYYMENDSPKEFLRIERAAYTHKHLICIFGIKQIVYTTSEPTIPFTPPSSRRNANNPFSFTFENTSHHSSYSDYELQLLGMIQMNQKKKNIHFSIWNPFFNQKLFSIMQKSKSSKWQQLWNKIKFKSSKRESDPIILLQQQQQQQSNGSSEVIQQVLFQQLESHSIIVEHNSSLSNEEKALLFSFVLLFKIANKK